MVSLLFVSLLALVSSAAGQEEAISRAIADRQKGDWDSAIAELRTVLRQDPGRANVWLMLGETLGWAKRFSEAEAAFRQALHLEPSDRQAKLALAQVLGWEARYKEAGVLYDRILAADPHDADALLGRAFNEYWAGDFRAARRDFQLLLAERPQDAQARTGLADLQAASLPRIQLGERYASDDQPYAISRAGGMLSFFSDPLTRWDFKGEAWQMSPGDLPSASLPYVQAGVECTLPSAHLVLSGWGGVLHSPDAGFVPLGGGSVSIVGPGHRSALKFQAERRDALGPAAAVPVMPTVDEASLRWTYDSQDGGILASFAGQVLRYFDGNLGRGADGYLLFPVTRGRFLLRAGPSAAYRDTDEERFRLDTVTVAAVTGGYSYSYHGVYDPYWTPKRLREVRGVVSIHAALSGRAAIDLHGTWGYSRDEVFYFGPSLGTTPAPPPAQVPVLVQRSSYPWSGRAGLLFPLASRWSIQVQYTVQSTAFYRAHELQAGLEGRF